MWLISYLYPQLLIEKIETPEGDGNESKYLFWLLDIMIEKIEPPEGDGNHKTAPHT